MNFKNEASSSSIYSQAAPPRTQANNVLDFKEASNKKAYNQAANAIKEKASKLNW